MGAIAIWSRGANHVRQTEERPEPIRSESVSIDARVSVYPVGENHPFRAISGMLEDHPLRDEYMEALGLEE